MTHEKDTGRTYHDQFAMPEADTVLLSNDMVYFRIPSITLRMSSGFFRHTLSLPQGSSSLGGSEAIPLDEDARVMSKVFTIICGLALAPADIESFEDITALLYTAEKYEIEAVNAYVRTAILSPRFLAFPIQLYALCCRYGWTGEAATASTRTLSLNLLETQYFSALSLLSSADLLRLLHLREARVKQLKATIVNLGGTTMWDYCQSCLQLDCVDVRPLREWRHVILAEFARIPSGDTIFSDDFLYSTEANAVYQIHCKNSACSEPKNYKPGVIIPALRQLIRALPHSIALQRASSLPMPI